MLVSCVELTVGFLRISSGVELVGLFLRRLSLSESFKVSWDALQVDLMV